MIRDLAQALPYIIAAMLTVAVLLFIVSVYQLRRGRTGSYWRLRREAGQRGGRLFLISIGLFVVAVAIAIFSGLADIAYQRLRSALENSDPNALHGVVLSSTTPIVRATITVTASATSTPTPTTTTEPDTATALPTVTETPTTLPTATFTPTITPTPSATFENVLHLTPPVSEVQPSPNANIQITAASLQVSADGTPINPSDAFPVNTQRIYVFMRYDNLLPSVSWSRILYRDGVPIQGQSYLWSLGASGTSYFFFGDQDGYPAGQYEIKLFVGQMEISHFLFKLS